MCTAKIPPRPRLFLLAALFLLAGCSPQYSTRVISETDGHAYPNDQYTYYIASSKKQNSDPTYQLLKQDVKSTLSEAGFSLTQDRNRGTALLSIDYTAKTSTKHITVKKPIYGQTGTVEKTHGTYDKATGRYTKTTTTTPTYGTVGYEDETKEVTECDIFLHLSAASSKNEQRALLEHQHLPYARLRGYFRRVERDGQGLQGLHRPQHKRHHFTAGHGKRRRHVRDCRKAIGASATSGVPPSRKGPSA